jgi:hypothetical protein
MKIRSGYQFSHSVFDPLLALHDSATGTVSVATAMVLVVHSSARFTKAIVYNYRKQYSGILRSNHDNKFTTEEKKFESDLTNVLKQKFGLDFIFFTAKDKDKPYGYAIIDHHTREVHKGSDVLKLDYLVKDSFVHDQKIFGSGGEEFKGFQNKRNLAQNASNLNLLEEKNADFVVGENTSNNEIHLGDLFEDFIRELEKENYESNGRARKKGRRMRGA